MYCTFSEQDSMLVANADMTCNHPAAERSSVSGADSKLGPKWRRPSLQSAPMLPAPDQPPVNTMPDFEGFLCPVTLITTENWHSTYLCPVERLCHFDISTFICFKLDGQTDGQTHGRA